MQDGSEREEAGSDVKIRRALVRRVVWFPEFRLAGNTPGSGGSGGGGVVWKTAAPEKQVFVSHVSEQLKQP